MNLPRRRWLGVAAPALLVVLLAAGGCTSHPDAVATGTRSVDAITHDITGANLDQRDSVNQLALDAEDPQGAQAARQVLAGSPSGDVRWAAVFVYAGSGTDPAPLAKLLNDSELNIRLLAAAGAVLEGDSAGFPVLIDLLTHNDIMWGSEPPRLFREFAATILITATADSSRGPAVDATTSQVAAAQKRWQQWWSASGATLKYNSATRIWSAS